MTSADAASQDERTSAPAAGEPRTEAVRPGEGAVRSGDDAPPEAAAPLPGTRRRPLRLTDRGLEVLAAAGAALFALLVSAYRIGVAHTARYPGHADPAFTYGVAQNIAAGRGPNIDYVWHFLVPGTPLHHYAFDYWLPLPSQLMARVLGHGHGLSAVLTLNVLLVVLTGAGAYALARTLSDVVWVPAAAAAASVVQPVISSYVMQAESAVYLGVFALPAMAAAVAARRRVWLWPVAGAFAGLAAMSRSEGMLLCVVLGVAALVWQVGGGLPRTRTALLRGPALRAGLLLAGYLVVSAPFLLTNLHHFGSPLPPAASAFPYVSSYENLYAVHVPRSLSALFDGSPLKFYNLRVLVLNLQLGAAYSAMPPIVSLLVAGLIGSAAFRSRVPATVADPADPAVPADPAGRAGHPLVGWLRPVLGSSWLVPVGFLLLVTVFECLVAPAVAAAGAIVKVMLTGVPVLLVLAVVQLGRLRLPAVLSALCCAVLIGYPLTSLAYHTRATIRVNNGFGHTAAG
ncbi:MAG: hypothetical protein JO144_16960, partial [Actinobacteria bacterium]|nr:hypothetical protein [Actinomycetota bacterium]